MFTSISLEIVKETSRVENEDCASLYHRFVICFVAFHIDKKRERDILPYPTHDEEDCSRGWQYQIERKDDIFRLQSDGIFNRSQLKANSIF